MTSINDNENNDKKNTFFSEECDLINIIFFVVLLIVVILLCYYFYFCSSKNNVLNTPSPIIDNIIMDVDNTQNIILNNNIPEISCELEKVNNN
jgi:hypothetical protein